MVDGIFKAEADILYYLLAALGLIEGFAVVVSFSFECWRSLTSRELKLFKVVFSEALRVFNLISARPRILRIRHIALSGQELSFYSVRAVCFLRFLVVSCRVGTRSKSTLA